MATSATSPPRNGGLFPYRLGISRAESQHERNGRCQISTIISVQRKPQWSFLPWLESLWQGVVNGATPSLLQGFGLRPDHHFNRLALAKTGVMVCSEDD